MATLEPGAARFRVPFDPPRTCRFIRLEQTGRDPTAWWSIHELTVP